MAKTRKARIKRTTKETDISLSLVLDGTGKSSISTGIGFLDHMLTLFSKHGCFDVALKVKGDLEVDIHHTNEDVAICLGQAFLEALAAKEGITRFAGAYCAMDEALCRVVLDVSNRSFCAIRPAKIKECSLSDYTYNYFKQFIQSFVANAKMTVHIDILEGEDLHHMLEACFKALALALRRAVQRDARNKGIPSTKGIL